MSASVLQVPKFGTFIAPITNSRDEFGQPRFFTMQIFTRSEPVGQRRGTLSLGAWGITDEGIWDPYAKFQLEEPSTGPAGTMHIKSCYNQKYLCKATQDPNDSEIAAMADEPEEDTSKWSCTLFRLSGTELTIQYNNRTWVVRGQHMQTPNEDIWMRIDNGTEQVNNALLYTSFELVNLDTLPTLPTHVCFKGDNDRYLRVVRSSGVLQAVFTGTDRREREAQFQVVRTRSRSVVLIPVAFPDTYITRSGATQYVAAPSNVQSNRNNALLEPVMLNFAGPAAVAFKSIPHLFRHFLVRRESEDNALIVSGVQSGIVAQAEFLTEDTVRSRQLSNIHFMYDDMRILDPTPVAVLTKNVVNGSKVSTQQAQLGFRYAEYHSSHWETTHSWQVGVSWGSVTTISARLPVLKFIRAETTVSVEVEAGYQGEHIAGETKEEESEMSTNFTVQVPPNTQTLVNMVVTRAKVILPFSYTEREMLHDGSSKATKKVDGLYEGEATHVDYQVQESSL